MGKFNLLNNFQVPKRFLKQNINTCNRLRYQIIKSNYCTVMNALNEPFRNFTTFILNVIPQRKIKDKKMNL